MHAFSSPHVTLFIRPTFPHRGIRCLEDTVLVRSPGRLIGISSDGSSPVVPIRSLVARRPGPTPYINNSWYICLEKCQIVSLWEHYLTSLTWSLYLMFEIHAVQSNSNHSFAETHPEHNLHHGLWFPQGNQKMTNKTRKGTLCIVDKT